MRSNDPAPDHAPVSASGAEPSPLLQLRIIWGALLFSVALYVGLAFFVQLPPAAAGAPQQPFELIFAVAALGSLGASYFVPQLLIKQLAKPPTDAPLDEKKLARLLMTPWIVRLALCESVAVLGLMLAFVSQQPMKIVPFAALSALAMLTAMPTETALRRAIDR